MATSRSPFKAQVSEDEARPAVGTLACLQVFLRGGGAAAAPKSSGDAAGPAGGAEGRAGGTLKPGASEGPPALVVTFKR